MSTLINHHPALILNSDVLDICKPLKRLGINYFAHVHIDSKNRFTALASSAGFTEHYLRNQYYNVDIHMASKNNKLGSYVIWDMIERKGLSAKMHSEAAAFGVEHTFTIIEADNNGKNYYHFASATKSLTINQTYLANLDLLKLFIEYFNEQVKHSRELSNAYKLKFSIAKNAEGYLLASYPQAVNDHIRNHFIDSVTLKNNLIIDTSYSNEIVLLNRYTQQPVKLTKQQAKCLHLLSLGNSNKQIAVLLGLSPRTVENYFDRIRTLLDCTTSKELIALYYSSTL